MNLLPIRNSTNDICDGSLFKAFDYCKKNCKSQKCAKYYNKIAKDKQIGFSICPNGLSTYAFERDGEICFFTGFRCKEYYKKRSRFSDSIYSPVLEQTQMKCLIDESIELFDLRTVRENELKRIQENNHEIKKLNSQIKENCDSLLSTYVEKNDLYTLTPEEYNNLFKRIRTLYVISNLVSFRNSLMDFEIQPSSLGIGKKIVIDIYRKFDKYRKVLKEYGKNIPITLSGSSYKRMMGYPTFEFIPFLLLENATKYTTQGKAVEVVFCEAENSLTIDVKSYGPYCSQDEITRIFEKGFRGSSAKEVASGSGLGLFFVKKLCEIHSIDINVETGRPLRKNNIEFSDFVVHLVFNDLLYD